MSLVVVLACAIAAFLILTGASASTGASAGAEPSPTSKLLTVAKYAASTASHSRPPVVVENLQVANAFATTSISLPQFSLQANLGDLFNYPRLILVVNSTTFSSTCVYFPDKVGAEPSVTKCPKNAQADMLVASSALDTSRNAIANAASKNEAVSGADVAAQALIDRTHLVTTPAFKAGQGGAVTFSEHVTNSKTVSTDYVCIQFPTKAYGIPFQVRCSS